MASGEQRRPNYGPGRDVHWIQAKLALSAVDRWLPVAITAVNPASFRVSSEGRSARYRCADIPRLKELIDSGTVARDADGHPQAVLVDRYTILLVPHSNPGDPPPTQLGINPTVTAVGDSGGAVDSPADGGGWGLFSIARIGPALPNSLAD